VSRPVRSTEPNVLAMVSEQPGSTTNEIARLVGGRRKDVIRLLRVSEARGVVESVPGPRRAELWFLTRRSGASEETRS
jgi:DNA-binding MarR family transcriptional regulator